MQSFSALLRLPAKRERHRTEISRRGRLHCDFVFILMLLAVLIEDVRHGATEALEGGMDRITPELDRKFERYPEETRICAAMESIWKGASNSLEILSRNESRLARLHHRALQELLKLREFVPPPPDYPVETALRPSSNQPVEEAANRDGKGAVKKTPASGLAGETACPTSAGKGLALVAQAVAPAHLVFFTASKAATCAAAASACAPSEILRNEPGTPSTSSVSDSNQPGPFPGPRRMRIMRTGA